MLLRVLGCSGAIAARCRTTSFLVGERLLVDAGTGVGDLELAELLLIDDVLLTHSHLDHVAALPLLADSVLRQRHAQRRPPIRVHALAPTLQALRQHLFNDVIWPDFTVLPEPGRPVLELHPLQTGQTLQVGGLAVEVLPAFHTVPPAGYAIWPFGRTVVQRPDADAPSLIGNVIWFILAGWWIALGHIVAGVLQCITIIGIPFGVANFKLARLAIMPLGREIVPIDYQPAPGEQVLVSVGNRPKSGS